MSEELSRRRRWSSATAPSEFMRRRTSTTKLVRVIRGEKDVAVTGLGLIGDYLYVTRQPSHQEVTVYDAKTFDFTVIGQIKVDALHDETNGLVASPGDRCLYISDWDRPNGSIHRIILAENDAGNTIKFDPESIRIKSWRTRGLPYGLSLSSEGNVIAVTCTSKSGAIEEYSKDGTLVREIFLRSELAGPLHALQIPNGQFIISHCSYENVVHRVCFVDAEGQVVVSYGCGPGSAIGQLNEPRQMALDGKTGYIFVADKNNDRVTVLHLSRSWWRQDLSLTWSRDILGPDNARVVKPMTLCLDESQGRLYVGQVNGNVAVYDNIIEK